jgi:DNA-binding GntR family transcriptional regulator
LASTGTVREALSQLTAEGIMIAAPQKGLHGRADIEPTFSI